MKAVVLKLLSLGVTLAVAAYIDRSEISKERRNKFIESYNRPKELEHIREGLQTLQSQQKQQQSKGLPSDVKKFSEQRQKLQKLDKNSSLSLSISANNEGLEEFLYQSDILLTPNQIDQMVGSNSRQKRQAAIGVYKKWDKTKPVYYRFDANLDPTVAETFRAAAMFWTNNTCLNIVESDATPNIRVFFGSGCYSYVGYTGSTTQDLSIGYNCGWFGVTTHELAHALGFWHEQSRHDRDEYVSVDTSNMDDFYLYNWGKESTATNDNYNLPYDWGSGMHYGESAYKGGPIFAIANDKIYQSTMGSYSGPSFKDVYEMNLHYDCMCSTGVNCQNGGFRHPRNCSQCICPSGFGGTTCDGLQPAQNGAANIGSILTAQPYFQPLTAKTGDPSKILQRPQVIHWHITAPIGTTIEINVQRVEGQCNVGCPWGSLDVKIKNFNLVGSRFCCESDIAANPTLVSIDNFAIISLYSQAYEHSFSLQYRYIDPNSPNSTATPPSAPTTTTPIAPCVDKFNDCQRYDVAVFCNASRNTPEGYAWQMENCAKHCGACGSVTTTTPAPTCVDIFDDCQRYNKASYCDDANYVGRPWMFANCAKFCDACGGTSTTTTGSPTTCVDKFNDCQRYDVAVFCNATRNTPEGYAWQMENCAKHCGACDTQLQQHHHQQPTTPA